MVVVVVVVVVTLRLLFISGVRLFCCNRAVAVLISIRFPFEYATIYASVIPFDITDTFRIFASSKLENLPLEYRYCPLGA